MMAEANAEMGEGLQVPSAEPEWRLWIGRLAVVSRLIVGGAFIVASFDKILDPVSFAKVVDSYQLLPPILISPFAITLPWVEFIAGTLLVLGVASQASALLIFAMLVMFIIAVAINLGRGANIDCGCFGAVVRQEPIGWHTIARDLVLLGLSLHALFFDRPSAGLEYLLDRRRNLCRSKECEQV